MRYYIYTDKFVCVNLKKEIQMKSTIAIIATLFAASVFAADAPKADAPKAAEKAVVKPAKSEGLKKDAPKADAKSAKSEPAKKDAPKAAK